jgi:predicted ABC-type ATPase/soluble cytochrome b562
MTLDPDRYRLTEAQHQAIFDKRIKPQLFKGVEPSDKPVAVIFGGQPGAGKSAAVDAAVQELSTRGRAAQIIGDDLRAYHPKYDRLLDKDDKTAAFYTDRDTARWVEKAIDYAKQNRLSVVIEGTMRDQAKVAQTMQTFRGAGYDVDARVLAVNEKLSWQGVLQRYENQKADRGVGRMTTPEAHEAAYKGMPATVERVERDKLADRLTVYRRGAEVLYSNALKNGEWSQPPQARAVIEAERSRPMTAKELKDYAGGFDTLAQMLQVPERKATPAEVQNIDVLRKSAHFAAQVQAENPYAKARKGAETTRQASADLTNTASPQAAKPKGGRLKR